MEALQLDQGFIQDPHRLTALLREQCEPVRPVIMPRGLPGWLVTGHAEAKALLADPRLSKNSARIGELLPRRPTATGGTATEDSRALAEHMLNMDPPDHTRLRGLVNKAFTAKTVARLRPRIEQIADALLDDLAGLARGAEFDLLDAYAFPLPITVICELLGVPEDERGSFRSWSTTMVSAGSPEEVAKVSAEMTAYLGALIEGKRRSPTGDLLSDLVHVGDGGDQLSRGELLSMAFLLLIAGHETTVNLIGNAVLALLRAPDQLAALRADPALLPGAVEEFLRFDGPVNIATLRFTTEAVPCGDHVLPPDVFVLVSLLGANRDERRFADPGRLDVTRPASGHLAFGHGIHYCVGAPLARLEGEVAIGRLIARFGDTLRLAGPAEELRWRRSTLIRGLERLPVSLS
ncbi:cytochrome P450 [Saccharomonospora sp. NPDC006951]